MSEQNKTKICTCGEPFGCHGPFQDIKDHDPVEQPAKASTDTCGKMWPTEEKLTKCENCYQTMVTPSGMCIQCGHHQGKVSESKQDPCADLKWNKSNTLGLQHAEWITCHNSAVDEAFKRGLRTERDKWLADRPWLQDTPPKP